MSEFNEDILLAIRWLQNPNLIDEKILKRKSQVTNLTTAISSLRATTEIYLVNAAIAQVIDSFSEDHIKTANTYLQQYFKLTKEDRRAYEQRAKHLNVLGANNE